MGKMKASVELCLLLVAWPNFRQALAVVQMDSHQYYRYIYFVISIIIINSSSCGGGGGVY